MGPSKRYANFKTNYRKDIKSFVRSIVALLMTVMLVFGSTFAWIEGSKNAKAEGEECTISAGAGLRFIGVDDGDIKNGVLTLPNSSKLEDCSSVDGRNIFIPTTGSIRPSTASASTTTNLKFRSAVESDKNIKYLTKDFIVQSLESKSESNAGATTPIFIDSSSSFSFTGSSGKAIRVSLNFNDGTAPVVLCPALGLSDSGDSKNVNAVSSISSSGVATTTTATSYKINKYNYGATPVYNLPYGESRKVTVTLWLEGTDIDCTASNVASKELKMNLVLSTEDSNMRTITFVDHTPSSWVSKDSANLYVVNTKNTNDYTLMTKSGNTYTARIKNTIENIYFQRVTASSTPGSQDMQNDWCDTSNTFDTSSNKSAMYYAIGRGPGDGTPNASFDDKNYGYWVNENCTGVVTIKFTDKDNKYADAVEGYPYIYMYDVNYYGVGNDKILLGKGWPGFHMHQSKQDNNNSEYTFVVPAVKGAKIIFNGGSDNKIEFKEGTHYTITDQNENYSFSFSN